VTLAPGAIIGAYHVVASLGASAGANTYKAYQPELARYVVLRLLPPIPAGDAQARERVLQETAAIARLRHPNILAVLDYGEAQGYPYLVTEFVEGGTLSRRLGTAQPLGEAVQLFTPIAWALDYAHTRGVIHGGVKPSNILLALDGTPLLTDFGLVRLRAVMQGATQSGDALAATEYTAPEQALGQEPGPPVDEYALSAILYEWLTGRPPFQGPTPLATLIAHTQQPVSPPHDLNPALDRAVDGVLIKGLAKRPEDRYSSAGELLLALDAAGQRATTDAPSTLPMAVAAPTVVGLSLPPSQALAPSPPARATRRALLAAPVAVLGLLAGGAYVVSRRSAAGGTAQASARGASEQPTSTAVPATAPPTRPTAPPTRPPASPAAKPSPATAVTQLPVSRPTAPVPPAPTTPAIAPPTVAPTAAPVRIRPLVAVPPMNTPRYGHTATLLSNGNLLVVGGQDDQGSLATAEIYNPAANQWNPAGKLATARYGHTAALLHDGKVLIAGGQANDHTILATAETYDPAANLWSSAAPLTAPRCQHTATLLASGQLLVTGGWDGASSFRSSERYDPAVGRWSGGGTMAAARRGHTATLLPDARVLVIGGLASGAGASAELYHPAGTWTTAASTSSRTNHVALLLPNRLVLATGGSADQRGALLKTAERYDAATDQWSAAGMLIAGRTGHTAALLPGGQALVAGGRGNGGIMALVERYDVATNAWNGAAPLGTARWQHVAAAIPGGSLLVVGGQAAAGALADVEAYDPAGNTWLTVG
jgi:serine/threonine protein kinase